MMRVHTDVDAALHSCCFAVLQPLLQPCRPACSCTYGIHIQLLNSCKRFRAESFCIYRFLLYVW